MSLFKILLFLCQCDKALRGGPDFRRLSVLVFCSYTLQWKSNGLPRSKLTDQSGGAFFMVAPPAQKPPSDNHHFGNLLVLSRTALTFPAVFFNAD